MTKNDIIETAFRVWGRDFYKKTSLSHLAKELKVSKPALYRHFPSKEALSKAMSEHFYDDFAASIHPSFESALKMTDPDKGLSTIIQTISDYFIRNKYAFIFSLMNAFDRKFDRQSVLEYISAKGPDMNIIRLVIEKKYNIDLITLRLILATIAFYIANFHKENEANKTHPTEEQINDTIKTIYEIIKHGLKFNAEIINNLDFKKLETLAESKKISESLEPLFKAVAEAVAEAGPWEASMEMVAKKMGLSKSSLYGHFKNKKDMLRRLFIGEFKRIIDFARQGTSLSSDAAEQLYLGIYSIAVYLKSRPEVLIAIDWIRTRKLELGNPHKEKFHVSLFEDIGIDSITSHWMMFLLIGVLLKTKDKDANEHILFRFITLGLGGFKQ